MLAMASTKGVLFATVGGLDPQAALIVFARRVHTLCGEEAMWGFPLERAEGVYSKSYALGLVFLSYCC